MRLVVVLIVVAATAVQAKRINNDTPTTEDKVKRIMGAVSDHCEASRKKRYAGESGVVYDRSEDKVRRLILNVIQDCLAGDDDKEPPMGTTPPIPDGPCSSPSTVNLTDWWRKDNKGSNVQPVDNYYNCDRDHQNNAIWFRITGAAGNRLRDSCVPDYSCGSHGGFWTDAEMPTEVGVTWQVPIYGSWAGSCDWYSWYTDNPLTVQRCSPRDGDFVYKVYGTQDCYWTFCGMD